MTIKNKDGNIYKLKHPNKLAITQNHNMDFTLHNFSWKGKEVVYKKDKLIESLQEQQTVIKKEIQEVEIKKEEPIIIEKKEKANNNIILCHCLPVIIKDKLYEEITYGKKFIFEAIITKQDDFSIEMKTNKEITENSVLFPYLYKNGKKINEFRWWKAKKPVFKNNYFIIEGTISDYQPYFSD